MTAAYVLIQTEIGKPPQVVAALRSIPGLGSAELVTGPYDIILRVEAEDIDSVGKLVVGEVQSLEGVVRTLTCPVIHL